MITKKKHLRKFCFFLADQDEIDDFKLTLEELGEENLLSWDDTYLDSEAVTSGYAIWLKENGRYMLSKQRPIDRIIVALF